MLKVTLYLLIKLLLVQTYHVPQYSNNRRPAPAASSYLKPPELSNTAKYLSEATSENRLASNEHSQSTEQNYEMAKSSNEAEKAFMNVNKESRSKEDADNSNDVSMSAISGANSRAESYEVKNDFMENKNKMRSQDLVLDVKARTGNIYDESVEASTASRHANEPRNEILMNLLRAKLPQNKNTPMIHYHTPSSPWLMPSIVDSNKYNVNEEELRNTDRSFITPEITSNPEESNAYPYEPEGYGIARTFVERTEQDRNKEPLFLPYQLPPLPIQRIGLRRPYQLRNVK